jgi:hypothetical protein
MEAYSATALGYEFKETPLGFYQKHYQPRPILGGGYVNLPNRFHLDMTPSKNQGPLGTCASFAAALCCQNQLEGWNSPYCSVFNKF